jgi:hypothetical protein
MIFKFMNLLKKLKVKRASFFYKCMYTARSTSFLPPNPACLLTTTYSLQAKKSGFTLLLAVLAGAILLTISIAVFNIAIKGSLLSQDAEESQSAFYSADAGADCAIYWDAEVDAFNPTSPVPTNVFCFGEPPWSVGATGYTSVCSGINCEIYNKLYDTSSYCVDITVTKYESPTPDNVTTNIRTRGFNTCDITNPRRVERSIEAEY